MRIGGLTTTTAQLKAYDAATWRSLLCNPRGILNLANVPWPLIEAPGRLIFFDDMEGVLKWTPVEGTVSRDSSIHVFHDSYALKMLTGGAQFDVADAVRSISFPGGTKFRLMCHWHAWPDNLMTDNTAVGFVIFGLNLFDGVKEQQCAVEYVNYEGGVKKMEWRYYNAAGGWTKIAGSDQYIKCGFDNKAYPVDNFLLMDCDITGAVPKIKRLQSNHLNLTGLDLTGHQNNVTDTRGLEIDFCVEADAAVALAAWFDDVALGDLVQP